VWSPTSVKEEEDVDGVVLFWQELELLLLLHISVPPVAAVVTVQGLPTRSGMFSKDFVIDFVIDLDGESFIDIGALLLDLSKQSL